MINFEAAKIDILNALDHLSPALTYHGKHHTLDVLAVAEHLCLSENISVKETTLVLTAALLHDIGFLRDSRQHEAHSCQFAHEMLPKYGFTEGSIKRICGLIMATKIPQSPHNALEKILCDADLDYLGRDDFYTIGQTLFEEMKTLNLLKTTNEWNNLQIRFLENHHFFTRTNRGERTRQKEKHLDKLRNDTFISV